MYLDKFMSLINIKKVMILGTFSLFFCNYGSLKANENIMILDNLSSPGMTTQKQNWAFFTDGVMGGLSEGKAIISNVDGVNCYHMTGNVTTENNGGFIQIRNQLKPTISTKKYKGIYLKVYGNKEDYSIVNLHFCRVCKNQWVFMLPTGASELLQMPLFIVVSQIR